MWAFRTRPERLNEQQQQGLEELFEQIGELRFVYYFRWGISEIFDVSTDREDAAERFEDYRGLLSEEDQELLEFFATYDAHRQGILAYFDERKTSGVVEGINNKARVITKRCYGVKSPHTLWSRLCLDLNLASRVACRTVQQIKRLTSLIRAKFLAIYT
jgi:transposase